MKKQPMQYNIEKVTIYKIRHTFSIDIQGEVIIDVNYVPT